MKRITNNNIFQGIKNLKNIHILTGWGEQAKYDKNLSIGYVMYLNNQGYKNKDTNFIIPSRPFMNNCITKNYIKWKQTTIHLLHNLITKNLKFDNIVAQIKMIMIGDLKQSIKDMNTPPNAPYTIKKKGFNKPLVDTGVALSSITSEEKYE